MNNKSTLSSELKISDKRVEEIGKEILNSYMKYGTFSKTFLDVNKKLKLTVNEAGFVAQGIWKLKNMFEKIGGLL